MCQLPCLARIVENFEATPVAVRAAFDLPGNRSLATESSEVSLGQDLTIFRYEWPLELRFSSLATFSGDGKCATTGK